MESVCAEKRARIIVQTSLGFLQPNEVVWCRALNAKIRSVKFWDNRIA